MFTIQYVHSRQLHPLTVFKKFSLVVHAKQSVYKSWQYFALILQKINQTKVSTKKKFIM